MLQSEVGENVDALERAIAVTSTSPDNLEGRKLKSLFMTPYARIIDVFIPVIQRFSGFSSYTTGRR